MKLLILYTFQKKTYIKTIKTLPYIALELYKKSSHFISLMLFTTYGSSNLSMYNDV